MKDKPFIGIAGNIGVGKTTFTSFVAKKFNLVDIYEQLGYDKNTIKFINSISEKIASTFYSLKMNEALKFLIQFDSDNKSNYIKYLK